MFLPIQEKPTETPIGYEYLQYLISE